MCISTFIYYGMSFEIRRGPDADAGIVAAGWYWSIEDEPFEGPYPTKAAAISAAKADSDQCAAIDAAERTYAAGYAYACGYQD